MPLGMDSCDFIFYCHRLFPPPVLFGPSPTVFLILMTTTFLIFFVYYKPFLVNEGTVYISFWCDNKLMRFLWQWTMMRERAKEYLGQGVWALNENLIFISRCILLIQGDKRIFLFYREGCFLDRTALTRFQYSNGMSHGLQTGHSHSLSLCHP